VEKLSAQFPDTFRSDLQSVVLFGSVARGEAIPGVSDMNILVLLSEVTNAGLGLATPFTQDVDAGRQHSSASVLLGRVAWHGGGTFAIEIADMRNARQVLYGVDPVPTPNASNLRYHAEHEIRQTMRHVRLRLLLVANEPREIGHLLVSSVAPYMRAAVRLSGQEAPLDTPTVIERAATLIDADPSPLIECHRARGGRGPSAFRSRIHSSKSMRSSPDA
jgi:hypothetical protein